MQKRGKDGKFKTATPWWKEPTHKICYFDLETTGFKGDVNWVICWAVLGDQDNKVVTDYSTTEEMLNYRQRDKRIIRNLRDELAKYDTIVTYNGIMFDAKMFRTRLMHWGYKPFKYKEKLHIDLYWKVKSLWNLSRASLANATKFSKIVGKTPLEFDYWTRASYGDMQAMKKLLEHNRQDVLILRDLFWHIEPYCKPFEKKSF